MKISTLSKITVAAAMMASLEVNAQSDLFVYKDGAVVYRGGSEQLNDAKVENGRIILTGSDGATVFESAADSINFDHVVMTEDFSFLTGADGPWDSAGENRYDKWQDKYATTNGWECRQTSVYSRNGYIKFGKSGWGGDLISAPFASIGEGSATLEVSLKAVGYCSTDGTSNDPGDFYVGVVGGGKVVSATGAGFQEIVDGVAYADADKNPISIDGVAYCVCAEGGFFTSDYDADTKKGTVSNPEIWNNPVVKYSFTVEGATKDSRLVIMTGKCQTAKGSKSYRTSFDDIIVREK